MNSLPIVSFIQVIHNHSYFPQVRVTLQYAILDKAQSMKTLAKSLTVQMKIAERTIFLKLSTQLCGPVIPKTNTKYQVVIT